MKTRRTWRGSAPRPSDSRAARVRGALAAGAGALRGRNGWALGAVAVLVLGVVAAVLIAGRGGESGPPDPRARQYKEFDACLLTDEKGIAEGAPGAPVWAGMQRASLETRARVTYVPVVGEQSVKNAGPFLNGLLQRDCELVLAAGRAPVAAVTAAAGDHPDLRFVVVPPAGSTGSTDPAAKGGTAKNVTAVAPGAGVPDEVAERLRRAVKAAGL
ncbi:BMP family ABC transporter substrate-binding protein [Streptomyces sp. LP05-1]|uniref:BMP family ABC transporter substrate-binding protein n=1 Tax=Streptomyces pyxinae TaxID=2970734 RepID=A0ABT2CKB0_9ACTN|nr:BMP family ABC transporter substrate-binding protein [Streptomyces sp. LP05-1]MCS0637855.1 BMP family ABC transporter substrate-binding protein [Streptomyces sp. LP05-1]